MRIELPYFCGFADKTVKPVALFIEDREQVFALWLFQMDIGQQCFQPTL
jgi:hypothetical protein